MPWCPVCRTEYVPGISRCADCGALLTETLPPEPPAADMVLLTTLSRNSEIAQLQGLLKSAGIPFYAADRGSGGYLRITMGFSVYGQDIYVERSRLEAARELMRSCMGRGHAMVFEDEEEPAPQEETGSGSYRFYLAVLAAFFLLLLYSVIGGFW